MKNLFLILILFSACAKSPSKPEGSSRDIDGEKGEDAKDESAGDPDSGDDDNDSASAAVCDDSAKETRVRFEKALADFGESCREETQELKCVNGKATWSGSYTADKCDVRVPRLNQIADNNDGVSGFNLSVSPDMWLFMQSPGAFRGNYMECTATVGSESHAIFTFPNIPAGTYEVHATWVGLDKNQSLVKFSVSTNDSAPNTSIQEFTVNQKTNASDYFDQSGWKRLGSFTITKTQIIMVTLKPGSTGYFNADALRLVSKD
jgi:hypothetical protein